MTYRVRETVSFGIFFFSIFSRLSQTEMRQKSRPYSSEDKTKLKHEKNFFRKHFFWHFQLLRRERQQKQQLVEMGGECVSESVLRGSPES